MPARFCSYGGDWTFEFLQIADFTNVLFGLVQVRIAEFVLRLLRFFTLVGSC